MPSSTAPESSPTLGCRSSRAWALVSTGRAARTGSATVRRASTNSTTPSRGGSAGRNVAVPVTGTKLTSATLAPATDHVPGGGARAS